MDPSSATWKLGENRHGQPYELRMSTDYLTKQKEYSIYRGEAGQRDNPDEVRSIPLDVLRKLASIINELK